MRSLIILALLTNTAFAGFLLDDQGGKLTDGLCGPILQSGGGHCLAFHSEWPTGQVIEVGFDVKVDKTAISIGGKATSPTLISTQIAYVPSPNVYQTLKLCAGSDQCSYDWPSSVQPSTQANEIIFFMTDASGRWGASTRISRPQ